MRRGGGAETYPVRTQERATAPAPASGRTGWVPTIDRTWVFVALALPAIVGLTRMSTIDLAYHVRTGNLILAHGIPRVDSFTFTVAGRPWLDQQWGAQVILASVYRLAGWPALALLRSALLLLTFASVWLACRAAGASKRSAAVLTALAFVGSLWNLGMRPQLLAMPLFTITLWLVLDREAHPGRLWFVPLLAVAWANVHGSFVLAPALLALALLEDLRRHAPSLGTTARVTVATLAATLVNPFGLGAWRYAFEIASSPTIRTTVQEWAPTTIRDATGVIFFASALGVVVLLARRKPPAPWFTLLWLGAFFVLALPALRGVVWWALVAPPIVAPLIPGERKARDRRGDRGPLNVAVIGSLVVLFVVMLPWRSRPDAAGAPPQLTDAPQRLVEATAAAVPPGGHVFVDQGWGSWFELALPDRPIFVDSRIEIFPERVWRAYDAVMGAREGWQAILDRWDVRAVVLKASDTSLASRIGEDPGWRLASRDDLGAVYVRA